MAYFKKEEFACKCCGEVILSEVLLSQLEQARGLAGVPFVVTSGYRCKKHNKAVGGVANSSHTRGFAADIKVNGSANRFKILNALMAVGFNRIGVYETFIHVDVDPKKPKGVCWYG